MYPQIRGSTVQQTRGVDKVGPFFGGFLKPKKLENRCGHRLHTRKRSQNPNINRYVKVILLGLMVQWLAA